MRYAAQTSNAKDNQMTAFLIVRAQVPKDDRADFDAWYQNEHLPDAHKAFQSVSARRGWSEMDDGVHVAIYEFSSLQRAQQIADGSDEITALIVEFDRVWQDRVVRSREVVGVKQSL